MIHALTPKGPVSLDALRGGEECYAPKWKQEEPVRLYPEPVEGVTAHESDTITIDGITVPAEALVATPEGGWIPASDIKVGDKIQLWRKDDGAPVEHEVTSEPTTPIATMTIGVHGTVVIGAVGGPWIAGRF